MQNVWNFGYYIVVCDFFFEPSAQTTKLLAKKLNERQFFPGWWKKLFAVYGLIVLTRTLSLGAAGLARKTSTLGAAAMDVSAGGVCVPSIAIFSNPNLHSHPWVFCWTRLRPQSNVQKKKLAKAPMQKPQPATKAKTKRTNKRDSSAIAMAGKKGQTKTT